jgi:hypothetical protein
VAFFASEFEGRRFEDAAQRLVERGRNWNREDESRLPLDSRLATPALDADHHREREIPRERVPRQHQGTRKLARARLEKWGKFPLDLFREDLNELGGIVLGTKWKDRDASRPRGQEGRRIGRAGARERVEPKKFARNREDGRIYIGAAGLKIGDEVGQVEEDLKDRIHEASVPEIRQRTTGRRSLNRGTRYGA